MDPQGLVVKLATLEDVAAIARLQEGAYAFDSTFRSVFPVSPTSGATFAHLRSMYEDPTFHVIVAKDPTTGRVWSYAIWHFVPAKTKDFVQHEMLATVPASSFPAGANIDFGQRVLRANMIRRLEIMNSYAGVGAPHGYLAAIGTDPSYQGDGTAAAQILAWAIVRAEALSIPMYFEGPPQALTMYTAFGFQQLPQEGQNSKVCMIRPAVQVI